MHESFRQHVESLHPSFENLLVCTPFTFATLPKKLPLAGVYVFSEQGKDLYVGRTNNIRSRIQQHCRPGSGHNTAPFAFRLAREAKNILNATYTAVGSRENLLRDTSFSDAFVAAKARVRAMDVRVVEESNPLRQALLEMYVAVVLNAPYNDFDNH
jgi:predicted GIY-YIG superfamily endonuclease